MIPPVIPETQVLGSKITTCESGNRHYDKNGEIIKGQNGERGIAQFKEATFYWMADMAKLENPEWENETQQIWLLNWAIENGYESHWTCAK